MEQEIVLCTLSPHLTRLLPSILHKVEISPQPYLESVNKSIVLATRNQKFVCWATQNDLIAQTITFKLYVTTSNDQLGLVDQIILEDRYPPKPFTTFLGEGELPRFICLEDRVIYAVPQTKDLIHLMQYVVNQSKTIILGALKCASYQLYHDNYDSENWFIVYSQGSQTKIMQFNQGKRTSVFFSKMLHHKLLSDNYERHFIRTADIFLSWVRNKTNNQIYILKIYPNRLQTFQLSQGATNIRSYSLLHQSRLALIQRDQLNSYQISPQGISSKAHYRTLFDNINFTDLRLDTRMLRNMSIDYIDTLFLSSLIVEIPVLQEYLHLWNFNDQNCLNAILLINFERITAELIIYSVLYSLKYSALHAVIILRYLYLICTILDSENGLQRIQESLFEVIPYLPEWGQTRMIVKDPVYQNLKDWTMQLRHVTDTMTDTQIVNLILSTQA